MRNTIWLAATFTAFLVIIAGCKKSEQRVERTSQSNGVRVDWPKVDNEFANSSPEVLESVSLIKRFIRYSQFPRAITELQKLASVPALTDSQKSMVADLVEQTKQATARTASPEQ
jgi:hypothetical protein